MKNFKKCKKKIEEEEENGLKNQKGRKFVKKNKEKRFKKRRKSKNYFVKFENLGKKKKFHRKTFIKSQKFFRKN